jgi:putative aldouronate transport system permease protein
VRNVTINQNKANVNKKKFKLKKRDLSLLTFLIPTVIYVFIFHYLPMGGLIIAFKDYNSYQGIFNSPWADTFGLKHFIFFFNLPNFSQIIFNTLFISVYSIIVNTTFPIVLALIINEVRIKWFKKTVQTVSYAPYFISVVVLVGMLFSFTDLETGIVNTIIKAFGGEPSNLMESAALFTTIYVVSGLWQGLGWWSIIYVGILSTVEPELHEAAVMDGASRMKRIRHINLPAIMPVAIIMLILSIGNMLTVGFEKIYLMQTSGNIVVSEVISTYVYRVSLRALIPQYSYATAIGLFNSIISIILLVSANKISAKVNETSLW